MRVTRFDMDALDPRYTTILCDLWGVVHDGFHLLPGAAARLARWTAEGRRVILVTNAPRTAETVRGQLGRLGLPPTAYYDISTAGQAGIDSLLRLSRPKGFLGTALDRAEMEAVGLRFIKTDYADLACTGLDDERHVVAAYIPQLKRLAGADVLFHCLNPDRIVIHGGIEELCAGALADAYVALGGRVCWYGKPEPAIYTHALGLAGDPPKSSVLAVGDGLLTDVLGAARQGIDCLFVSGGINTGASFPPQFASRHDLGAWRPIGVVPGLA